MPVCCLLLGAFLAWSPPPARFSADVTLPMEIYTADGSAIPKGRSFIEIRSQGDESRLVFLRERKTIAVVKGRPYSGAADFTLPIVGTILLRPPAPAKTETEKDADKNQVSPYLANIAWTATLRLYRTPNPANHEIHAVFRRGRRQLEFQLFSAPPAKPSTP